MLENGALGIRETQLVSFDLPLSNTGFNTVHMLNEGHIAPDLPLKFKLNKWIQVIKSAIICISWLGMLIYELAWYIDYAMCKINFIAIRQIQLNSLWHHMATEIWVNTGSGNGLLPDGTKPLPEPMLTDWSSVKSSDIHIRAISEEMPQPSITKICLKIRV